MVEMFPYMETFGGLTGKGELVEKIFIKQMLTLFLVFSFGHAKSLSFLRASFSTHKSTRAWIGA